MHVYCTRCFQQDNSNNNNDNGVRRLVGTQWRLLAASPPLYSLSIIFFCLIHTKNGDWMGTLISRMNMRRYILWEIMRPHSVVSPQYSAMLYWSFIPPTHLHVLEHVVTRHYLHTPGTMYLRNNLHHLYIDLGKPDT